MLSVLIAAREEKYLAHTIKDIFLKATGEIEVIVVLDGYLPELDIDDERLILIYKEESIGQRQAINLAATHAQGKYIMKLDAHCMVGEGFDEILAADCEYDWTVVPRMYGLDAPRWERKVGDNWPNKKPVDYMYITSPTYEAAPFRAQYYEGKEKDDRQHQPTGPDIDDTMCCMGPGWFMHKDRFWELGGCDEEHGSWGQQGIEVSLKAWLSGGSLKVNKKTWFAHLWRGDVGFPYKVSGRAHEAARTYSQGLWLKDEWPQAVRPLSWLINKFQPPGWERPYLNAEDKKKLHCTMYQHIHKGRRYPRWKGVDVLKDPSDMILYQQVIYEKKPDFIVEIGTKRGGSTTFLADMCELNNHGHVISVDIAPQKQPKHNRISYVIGNSIDDEVIKRIKNLLPEAATVMVILDGNHERKHVKWELDKYRHIVTPGQYMVCEDCYSSKGTEAGPKKARDWFLSDKRSEGWTVDNIDEQFIIGLTRDSWLLKNADTKP